MSAIALEYSIDAIWPFFQCVNPGVFRREHMTGIAVRKGGEILGALVFENVGRHNAWVHVAGDSSGHWLTRKALKAVFLYAFGICGLDRISGYIEAGNTGSRRFAEHLGFKVEAVLAGAAEDGGDVCIYVMWKKDCRYVPLA